MAKTSKDPDYKARTEPKPVRFKTKKEIAEAEEPFVHIYNKGAVCVTDKRGHASPRDRGAVALG